MKLGLLNQDWGRGSRATRPLAVTLVEWESRERRLPGVQWTYLRVSQLREQDQLACQVMVLSETALEQLDPGQIRKLTSAGWPRVVLVVDQAAGRLMVRWIQCGFRDVVFPEELARRLSEIWVAMWRPQVIAERWLRHQPDRDSDAWFAVRAVADLRRPFSVDEWADRLGWSRQRLWRACRSELRAAPKTVLGWYIAAVVQRGLADEIPLTTLALLLGYSDAAGLARVIREQNKSR